MCLRGEPGMGKSALLRFAAEQASEMCVLRAEGVPPEADLGYATLHNPLLPVTGWADRLPEPQSSALAVVFGRAEGPAPDRFLVAPATLSLLSEAATEAPLLCLVDDAQSADPATLDVLAFVTRRLEDEPIAVVNRHTCGRRSATARRFRRSATFGPAPSTTTHGLCRANDKTAEYWLRGGQLRHIGSLQMLDGFT
jgi:DNA replicative helicase MCM subunit Mcm2 (Cdc46/Mcm family)